MWHDLHCFCVCFTFPWTAGSSWWFPEQQSVFAPLLCSYRCSHSERTLLLAAHPLPLRWLVPIWAPLVVNAGHQLGQRANIQSAGAQKTMMNCVVVSLFVYPSHCHSQVSARRATDDRLSVVSFWAAPVHQGDPIKLGRAPAFLTRLHNALSRHTQM